jgi:hypothetical protein
MLRMLIGAAAIVVLSAAFARAQVTGPIPGSGMYGDDTICCFSPWPDYEQTRSPEQMERDRQIETDYRASLSRIPNRKPSNDPWKNIRSAPALDRHRPQ